MNKISLLIRIICIALVITVGVIWLLGIVSKYQDYKEDHARYDENFNFWDYIYSYYNSGFYFYSPILIIILGIYMLINTFVPKEDITHAKSIKLLNEYKSLLDSGIITQEEFYEKKQKLLKR